MKNNHSDGNQEIITERDEFEEDSQDKNPPTSKRKSALQTIR